jgi:hypothetical protein
MLWLALWAWENRGFCTGSQQPLQPPKSILNYVGITLCAWFRPRRLPAKDRDLLSEKPLKLCLWWRVPDEGSTDPPKFSL